MGVFKTIDPQLLALADQLKATLTKDRPGYPEALRTFEERRIDWVDNGVFKAIIIQPHFEEKGVNATIWSFVNIAWVDEFDSFPRPQWIYTLVDNQPFETIEQNIDALLRESEERLVPITRQDLKSTAFKQF